MELKKDGLRSFCWLLKLIFHMCAPTSQTPLAQQQLESVKNNSVLVLLAAGSTGCRWRSLSIAWHDHPCVLYHPHTLLLQILFATATIYRLQLLLCITYYTAFIPGCCSSKTFDHCIILTPIASGWYRILFPFRSYLLVVIPLVSHSTPVVLRCCWSIWPIGHIRYCPCCSW